MKNNFWLWIWPVLLLGCSKNVVYKQQVTFPQGVWTYDSLVEYEFSIEDTVSIYNISLNVEHTIDYAYQNLYVKIYTQFPNQQNKEDVLSLELANKNGLWNGSCGNSKCALSIPLQEKTYFQEPGVYAISLEQYMREESIEGIQSMELIISKTD